MAIFASRRVNVDPEPWKLSTFHYGTLRFSYEADGSEFEPRPEFDNVVNPLLLDFRSDCEFNPNIPVSHLALVWISRDIVLWEPFEDEEHIDHARRVLQKLAAFRG